MGRTGQATAIVVVLWRAPHPMMVLPARPELRSALPCPGGHPDTSRDWAMARVDVRARLGLLAGVGMTYPPTTPRGGDSGAHILYRSSVALRASSLKEV